jgi:hypothetical protein
LWDMPMENSVYVHVGLHNRLYHTSIWLEIEIPDFFNSSILNFNKILLIGLRDTVSPRLTLHKLMLFLITLILFS